MRARAVPACVSVRRMTGAPVCALPMLFAVAGPPGVTTLDGRPLAATAIDATVQTLMRANRVPGVALALVRDGQVAYRHAYGLREVARGLLSLRTRSCTGPRSPSPPSPTW
jgi:CubicO group peptidase (beta-lactamase class C family)